MLQTLLFAIGLNLVGFLVAFRYKTDKLTDISYALTFAGIALFGVATNEMSVVKWLVFGLVMLWSIRLGSFLLYRVQKRGRDSRFDEMRNSFVLFGRFWLLQGLTAWVVMLPASFLFQTEQATSLVAMTIFGSLVAFIGLSIETIADWQKFSFSQQKKNKGVWISSGLWKYSRHPNYFGEITMWYGVYTACVYWLTGIQSIIAIVSPLTIVVLLVGISGIPILEKSADSRWGKDKKYQAYKKRTSLLIPLPRKSL